MRKIFLSLLLIQSLMLQALNTDLIKNCMSDSENVMSTFSYTLNTSSAMHQVVNIAETMPELMPVVITPTQTGNLSSPSWTPVPNLQYNMSVIGKIQLSPGVFSLNENDILGAFVGTECRGVASPFVSFDGILFLTIGSNIQSGETVTFKIYLSSTNEIIDAIETIPFQNAGELGTMANPSIFTYNTLSITPSNQNVPASPAGSISFTVTTNSSWTASSNQTWCAVTPSGNGNGTVVATYTANATASQRIAIVTVTVAGFTPVAVTVTQPGTAPTLTVTPANQNVPASPAGSTSFAVTTNSSWTASSNQTWCAVTQSGNGNGTVVATYAANATSSQRIANITVTVAGLTPVAVTVTQAETLSTLTVTPANQNVPASPAGSTNFTVTSNSSWTASSNQTWCTVTPSGNGNGTVIANYAANATASQRIAIVTVTVAGLTPVAITVTQGALGSPSWTPVSNLQFNMSVIGKIQLSPGVYSLNENDILGAFVGTECRGVASPFVSFDGILFLTIGSNVQSGETVTFKMYLSSSNEIVNAIETIPFQNAGEAGTMAIPYIFTYSTLSITPSNQNVPASPAGSTNFTVTSNSSWTATSNQIWCAVTPSGSGNGTVTASYTANSTTSQRIAIVTVTVSGLTPVVVTVTQDPCTPPTAPTASATLQPTCEVSIGTITITAPTGTGMTYSINGSNYTNTTGIFTLVPAGTYTVMARNAAGCTSLPTTVTINAQPATPATPTVGIITQSTCSVAIGSVVLNALPAGSWTINPGGITGSTTTTTISNLAAGTYNFAVTNSVGCTSLASTNVLISAQPAQPAAPTVGTITQPTCSLATGSVVLSGLPAGSWILNPGAITGSTASTTIPNLAAGTYNFTVTNSVGCISSASVNVVINVQPAAPATPAVGTITQPTCSVATGSVVLNGLPTGNWTINPGAITGSTASKTISNLATGTYNFAVTNSVGCTSLASTNVVISGQPAQPAAATVGTITQPTCTVTTGSVVLSGLPAGNWTINPGAITGSTSSKTISTLAPGTYNFDVTNSVGCMSAASMNVVISAQPAIPTIPIIGAITQPTCSVATGSVVLSGLPAGSWTIDPGGITGTTASKTISSLTAGTYNYTVTNADSCTSTVSTNVIINAPPTPPTIPLVGPITQPTCTLATGSVFLYGLPANGNWTLTRNPGGTTKTGAGISYTIAGLSAGTYNYVVTNSDGCTSAASANAVINDQPTPADPIASVTQTTCAVASGTITVAPIFGAGYTLQGTNPYRASVTNGTGVFAGLMPGVYDLTTINAVGCRSKTISLTILPQPVTPAKPIITLNGNALHSNATTGNQWYNQTGAINSATTQDYTPLSSGDYYVVVSINGCSSISSNSIHYIPTGIDPTEANKLVKVYPNPVTNELVIEFEGNTNKIDFEVLNSIGQVVFSGVLLEKTIVQTENFTPGVYLIKLKSGKTFEFKKVIKK